MKEQNYLDSLRFYNNGYFGKSVRAFRIYAVSRPAIARQSNWRPVWSETGWSVLGSSPLLVVFSC
jgi:hypothetical protein